METRITLMWQDSDCVGGNCDAYYRADGGWVIQGKKLGPATTASLSNLDDDETAVFISAETYAQLRQEA
jgi:hypothetical protein